MNDKQTTDNVKPTPGKKPAKHVAQSVHAAIGKDRQLLEQKVEELTEALKRERADVINIRRRHDEQVQSLRGTAKAEVVRQLLPAIDNLERALKHAPAELADSDYVKGVQGVVKQFEKALQAIGVTRIATVGQPFNPDLHEAISVEDGEGDSEIVTEELQAGYALGDNVIRHAMVRVKQG